MVELGFDEEGEKCDGKERKRVERWGKICG